MSRSSRPCKRGGEGPRSKIRDALSPEPTPWQVGVHRVLNKHNPVVFWHAQLQSLKSTDARCVVCPLPELGASRHRNNMWWTKFLWTPDPNFNGKQQNSLVQSRLPLTIARNNIYIYIYKNIDSFVVVLACPHRKSLNCFHLHVSCIANYRSDCATAPTQPNTNLPRTDCFVTGSKGPSMSQHCSRGGGRSDVGIKQTVVKFLVGLHAPLSVLSADPFFSVVFSHRDPGKGIMYHTVAPPIFWPCCSCDTQTKTLQKQSGNMN